MESADGVVHTTDVLAVRRFLRMPPALRDLVLDWINTQSEACAAGGMRMHVEGDPNVGVPPSLPAILEVRWRSDGQVVLVGFPADVEGDLVEVAATAPPEWLVRWAARP